MSWNYRIMESHDSPPSYSVVEVYYNRKKIRGWCEVSLKDWDSLGDLKGTIKLIKSALKTPILTQDGDMLRERTGK